VIGVTHGAHSVFAESRTVQPPAPHARLPSIFILVSRRRDNAVREAEKFDEFAHGSRRLAAEQREQLVVRRRSICFRARAVLDASIVRVFARRRRSPGFEEFARRLRLDLLDQESRLAVNAWRPSDWGWQAVGDGEGGLAFGCPPVDEGLNCWKATRFDRRRRRPQTTTARLAINSRYLIPQIQSGGYSPRFGLPNAFAFGFAAVGDSTWAIIARASDRRPNDENRISHRLHAVMRDRDAARNALIRRRLTRLNFATRTAADASAIILAALGLAPHRRHAGPLAARPDEPSPRAHQSAIRQAGERSDAMPTFPGPDESGVEEF
jgi:hypothetical protein